MAFKKKTWVDRMVEYAGRRKITNVTTMAAQIVDVERAEGVVSEEGTAINAVNMNDLEQRTADAFSAVQQDIEGINSNLQEVGMTAEEKKQLQEIYDRIVTYAKYIVDLGSGTTFDVSGYEGYQNFTISNFIVSVDSASSTWTGYGDTGTNSCSATVIKNYNASSGILTLSGLSASRVGPGEIKLSIASRVYLITDPI